MLNCLLANIPEEAILDVRDELLHFVEEMALYFEETGSTRSVGRIIGWLLVSNPPYQTMNELVEVLQISRSSLSPAMRTLIQLGLVQRFTIPGDRRDYYRMAPGVWKNALQQRNSQVTRMRELAEKGLDLLSDQPIDQRERLEEMRDLYAFIEAEVPRLIDRWERERAKRKAYE